jgi:hypothetical protein
VLIFSRMYGGYTMALKADTASFLPGHRTLIGRRQARQQSPQQAEEALATMVQRGQIVATQSICGRSERGVRLAQKMQVGPCIPVETLS